MRSMIKVRLNGAVTYVEGVDHHHACHATHKIIATTLDPVLPDGDWIEVTSVDSEVREFVLLEHESGYLS